MSESNTSGSGITPQYFSPSLPPSDDLTAHHCGSSLSGTEVGGDRDENRRDPVAAARSAEECCAGGNSRFLYSAAEVPPLSPVAHPGKYMYAMDTRQSPLHASGNLLDFAELDDSQTHLHHRIELMQGGNGGVGLRESAGPLRNLSLSTYPTTTNVASFTPTLSNKNSISLPPAQTMLPVVTQPITNVLKPPGTANGADAVLPGDTPPVLLSSQSDHPNKSAAKVLASSSASLAAPSTHCNTHPAAGAGQATVHDTNAVVYNGAWCHPEPSLQRRRLTLSFSNYSRSHNRIHPRIEASRRAGCPRRSQAHRKG
ncbi:hypothetical protein Q4I32_007664 [Leishmania shawi]|uniref:Uncharacterized protein n=1 Tax=Leishmania shawi TaxID=5680 RepID=A0AAW3BAJ5_9TRYP